MGGLETTTKEATIAKDALTFMVVGVNSSWKIPLGFFFVAGLNAKGKNASFSIVIERRYYFIRSDRLGIIKQSISPPPPPIDKFK